MVESIHSLFRNLAAASTEQELRNCFIDNISEHFGVQRWGLYLLDEKNNLASFDVVGVSSNFVEKYDAIGKSIDPVLKYVLDYHAPARVGESKAFNCYDLASLGAVCLHLSACIAQIALIAKSEEVIIKYGQPYAKRNSNC